MPDERLTSMLRSMGRKDWLTPAMDVYFEERIPETWWGPNPMIHPSGAVGDCARDIQLALLGHKTAVDGRLSRIFDVGKAMHTRWQTYFRECGLLVVEEEPIESYNSILAIKGRLDCALKAPQAIKDELHVIELKSMNSGQYRRLPEPKTPKENLYAVARLHGRYVGQWLCYVRAYDEQQRARGEQSVQNGAIIFENKDTQHYKTFLVTYDEELWLKLTTNARAAQQAFLENRLVDEPYLRMSGVCQKCGRRDLCYALQDGDGETWRMVKSRLAAGLKRYRQSGSQASSTAKDASTSAQT